MAKQSVKKVTSRTTNKPDKEKTDVSAAEQALFNKTYEKNINGKLAGGEKASISEQAYADYKKTGNLSGLYNSAVSEKNKKVPVDISAKLPIRKPTTIKNNKPSELQKSAPIKSKVSVEIKYKKQPKVTSLSKGGKPGQRFISNVKTTAKNIVGKSKFKREEKLAGGFERVGKHTIQEDSFKKDALKDIKDRKSYVKSAEGKKALGKKEAKSQKKDLNLSTRYLKREFKNKNDYFTRSALAEKKEMTQAEMRKSNKKTQAGKTRFS